MSGIERCAKGQGGAIDSARAIVVVLSIVGYPLIAPVSAAIQIENRLLAVPFRGLVLTLALVVITASLYRADARRLSTPVVLWGAFWALYFWRIAIDSYMNIEALRLEPYEYWLYAGGTCFLPAVATASGRAWPSAESMLRGLVILGTVAVIMNLALFGFEIQSGNLFDLLTRRQGHDALVGIGLSHLGVSTAILSLWILTQADSLKGWQTFILFGSLSAGVIAAILGASRGPLLGLAVISVPLIRRGMQNLRRSNSARMLVLGIAVTVVAVLAVVNIDSIAAFGRIRDAMLGDDASVGVRLTMYIDGFRLARENPLLGGGLEPLGFYPHNVILESFLLYGFVSGLIFITIMVFATRRAFGLVKYEKFGWMGLLFLQYLIGAMVSGSLYSSSELWVLAALVTWCSGNRVTVVRHACSRRELQRPFSRGPRKFGLTIRKDVGLQLGTARSST